jgi:hypothetical protein
MCFSPPHSRCRLTKTPPLLLHTLLPRLLALRPRRNHSGANRLRPQRHWLLRLTVIPLTLAIIPTPTSLSLFPPLPLPSRSYHRVQLMEAAGYLEVDVTDSPPQPIRPVETVRIHFRSSCTFVCTSIFSVIVSVNFTDPSLTPVTLIPPVFQRGRDSSFTKCFLRAQFKGTITLSLSLSLYLPLPVCISFIVYLYLRPQSAAKPAPGTSTGTAAAAPVLSLRPVVAPARKLVEASSGYLEVLLHLSLQLQLQLQLRLRSD